MEFRKTKTEFTTPERINQVSQKFKLSSEVAELLLLRNLQTDEEIEKFLHPEIKNLHNPFLFLYMQEVVDKIKNAISQKQKILIFGDYDVDGITSSYILLDYFTQCGVEVNTFLPNRYSDGYGLTKDAIDHVIKTYAPNLIITVDCGISGVEEVEYIKSHGIDVIITDHHECGEVLPDCLIIDAKIPNQTYPFRELCGAGVAFKLVEALAGRDVALKYLPVTAIATVSDIVPLFDENRIIVKLGLDSNINNYPLGIFMLAKELKLSNKLTSQEVSFKLAPKLNAAGRMGDANHSLRLYIEKDKITLKKLITQLLSYNTERQDLCNLVYADCVKQLKNVNLANQNVIVLYNENWNIGILGIVSARIAEEYNRPTFLLGLEGEFYKGSCRSIEGMNVHSILTKLSDILTSFGGHTMAAGMTISADKIEDFKQRLITIVNTDFNESYFHPYCEYDIDMDIKKINIGYLKQYEILEPYGCQNPAPLFKINFDKVSVTPMKTNFNHLTIQLPTVNLLQFNSAKYFNLLSQGSSKECITELWIDTFRGNSSCKGIIKAIQITSAPNVNSERVGGEYIKQLALSTYGQIPKYLTYNKLELEQLLNDTESKLYGTLIVANTLQSYRQFIENSNLDRNIICHEYLYFTQNSGYNTICLCPSLDNDFKNYNRIILLDGVLDETYVVNLNNCSTAKVFIPASTPFLYSPFKQIDLSRKTFAEYFNIIKKSSKLMLVAFDDFNYYNKIKKTQHNLNYVQFVACLATFEQLDLIEINKEVGNFTIKMKSSTPTSLEKSHFYNKLELILKTY